MGRKYSGGFVYSICVCGCAAILPLPGTIRTVLNTYRIGFRLTKAAATILGPSQTTVAHASFGANLATYSMVVRPQGHERKLVLSRPAVHSPQTMIEHFIIHGSCGRAGR